jgi:hypothetical protein
MGIETYYVEEVTMTIYNSVDDTLRLLAKNVYREIDNFVRTRLNKRILRSRCTLDSTSAVTNGCPSLTSNSRNTTKGWVRCNPSKTIRPTDLPSTSCGSTTLACKNDHCGQSRAKTNNIRANMVTYMS